jgi:hypothetical protein
MKVFLSMNHFNFLKSFVEDYINLFTSDNIYKSFVGDMFELI